METVGEIKRQGFFDLIYGVLFNPVATFRGMSERPPFGQAAAVLFVLAFSNGIAGWFVFRTTLADTPGMEATALAPVLTGLSVFFLFFTLVFAGLKWFLYGSLLHLLAELWGGRGTPKGTLAVYALSGLPGVFLVPLQLILTLLRASEIISAALSITAGLVVLSWGAVLLIIGLREVHRFSGGAAVLTVVTPVAVVLVLTGVFVAAVFVVIGAVMPLLPPTMLPEG
ncbi:MAG TPA: YIP1 family protein [Desulfotomaculum sp.]|nr:YIP1 family protein [Desulfotomaculum sp.]